MTDTTTRNRRTSKLTKTKRRRPSNSESYGKAEDWMRKSSEDLDEKIFKPGVQIILLLTRPVERVSVKQKVKLTMTLQF